MKLKDEHNWLDITIIVGIIIYNLGWLLFTLLWLFTNSFANAKGNLTHISNFLINENVTYGLFLSGVLGGSFYCLRAIYQRLGEAYTPVDNENGDIKPNKSFNPRVWLFWYLFRPIQGGVLALILLTLINSSLITIETINAESLKSFYTLIAVGFLSGFGSHELIHKVQEIIQVLFAKSNIKSTDSKQKVKENKGDN
jgi:hypothetical protein